MIFFEADNNPTDQLLCAGHGGENGCVFRFCCQKL